MHIQSLVRAALATACILVSAYSVEARQNAPAGGSKPPPQPVNQGSSTAGSAPAASGDHAEPADPKQLEQLVAGIALYPDALVSQILMAATYPLEVVEAERWAKANPNLKDEALAAELDKQEWDASVKSLVNFPQVLTMMSEKLDWTLKLGDAFIADQKSVLDAIQRLRAAAKSEGALKSNDQQEVRVETQESQQVIVIESSSPDVVYVPSYDPVVVYGGSYWPPAYPPYCYYPPGYVAGTALVSFGVGLALGAAWGNAWGNCNWGGGDVDIDINRNTNFNRSSNRVNAQNRAAQSGKFKHDPSHRKGAPYGDRRVSQQYGGGRDQAASMARESYRGRAESGRQDINRGAADQFRGGGDRAGASNRAGGGQAPSNRASGGAGGAGDRGGAAGNRASGAGGSRPSAGASNRSGTSNRAASGGSSNNAFSGSRGGGNSARASSSRGASSRGYSGGGGRGGGGRGGGGRGGRR